MNGENKKDEKLEKLAEAASEILKEVPVYKDAIQPVAKEVGKSL